MSGSDCEVVAPTATSVVVLVMVLVVVVHASRLHVRVSVRSPPASMHNSSLLPSSTQREYRDCLPVPHVTEHSLQSDHSTSVTQTHTLCTQHLNTSLDTNEKKPTERVYCERYYIWNVKNVFLVERYQNSTEILLLHNERRRSQWLRGLRRRSAPARLLRL